METQVHTWHINDLAWVSEKKKQNKRVAVFRSTRRQLYGRPIQRDTNTSVIGSESAFGIAHFGRANAPRYHGMPDGSRSYARL